jgi:hypothetical protein
MKTTICAGLVALLAVAPAAAGLKVYVDHDEEFDFSAAKTFVWQPGVPAPDPLSEDRIFDGVDSALTDAGLQPLDAEQADEADLIVLTEVAGEKQMKKSNVSVGVGVGTVGRYGRVGVGTSTSGRAKEVTEGTLTIALLDARTGKLVWRANCTDTINENKDRTKAIIDKAIAKAFKKFPPGKK